MWLFLRYGSNTLLYFFLNESQKILLYETKERAILIKYRVHVRELWKWKWHRLDVFPRKFHPPFPSHLDGNWLFRSWRARMPSGRKLRRFEGKRVARFTYVASWNSPRPVIIVARSGAKAAGQKLWARGGIIKWKVKSSWNSSSYLENVHLACRGDRGEGGKKSGRDKDG